MRTIGIAGPSCSGKTALSLRLVEHLGAGASRLPLDAYYRDLHELPPELRAGRNFDHPDALDRGLLLAQLDSLAAGAEVEVPDYRFETHTRAPSGRTLRPPRILIVEGLFALYWKELRERLDLAVFVDCDDAVCLARRLRRDVCERGRSAGSVRAQYAATVRPMYRRFVEPTRAHADRVVDGAGPLEQSLASVAVMLSGFPR